MKIKENLLICIVAFIVIFAAQYSVFTIFNKSNNVGKFGVTANQITKDLDGRAVGVVLNQVWPFDLSQDIQVQVVGKKSLDEYVVVVIDVKATAPVQQDTTPKEQFSTNPHAKDVTKTPPKMPSKLQLTGRMKLTYELLEGEWYLVTLENLTLKATPLN